MAVRFVIIGGGPAGHTAATHAARLGAEVTLIERDIVGGAAHLWDCIPSKAMIATGGAMAEARRAGVMGLAKLEAELDFEALKVRINGIEDRLNRACAACSRARACASSGAPAVWSARTRSRRPTRRARSTRWRPRPSSCARAPDLGCRTGAHPTVSGSC